MSALRGRVVVPFWLTTLRGPSFPPAWLAAGLRPVCFGPLWCLYGAWAGAGLIPPRPAGWRIRPLAGSRGVSVRGRLGSTPPLTHASGRPRGVLDCLETPAPAVPTPSVRTVGRQLGPTTSRDSVQDLGPHAPRSSTPQCQGQGPRPTPPLTPTRHESRTQYLSKGWGGAMGQSNLIGPLTSSH